MGISFICFLCITCCYIWLRVLCMTSVRTWGWHNSLGRINRARIRWLWVSTDYDPWFALSIHHVQCRISFCIELARTDKTEILLKTLFNVIPNIFIQSTKDVASLFTWWGYMRKIEMIKMLNKIDVKNVRQVRESLWKSELCVLVFQL